MKKNGKRRRFPALMLILAVSTLAVLRETNLVSAIVEMGFLSNADDRTDLLSPSGQDNIAAGIAEGVRRWYLR